MRLAEVSQITGARLFVGGIMAETSLALGRKEQAQTVAAAHLELARRAGAMREQVRALRALAAVARADGEPARALDLADQALGLGHDRSDPIEHGRTLVFRSSVRLQLGDGQAAQRDLAEAMGIFERVGAAVDLEQARQQLLSYPRA
jgi:hypothetical protein